MLLTDALVLIKRICADFKGTLQDHQILQQAIQTVEQKCTAVVPAVEKEVKVENTGESG